MRIPSESGEWVFVYDISGNGAPVQKQILPLPNSFAGIAFNPSGTEFYVAGGQDDNVHVFDLAGQTWSETTVTTDAGTSLLPISLNHSAGIGPFLPPPPRRPFQPLRTTRCRRASA